MQTLAFLATALLAIVLSMAAAGKVVAPVTATNVLGDLGLSRRFRSTLVVTAVVIEWGLSLAVTLWPRYLVVRFAIIGLFGLFALLGMRGILRKRRIACGCFGALVPSSLGWWQVGQFAVAVAVALIAMPHAVILTTPIAIIIFAVEQVLASCVLMALVGRVWSDLRTTRMSLAAARDFHAKTEMPRVVGARA